MQEFTLNNVSKKTILALGAESAGNFSIYIPAPKPSPLVKRRIKGRPEKSILYFSEDFGDLLVEENFLRYQKELSAILKKTKTKPSMILSDLHPEFVTTTLAKKLAKKHKAEHTQVQHHQAHVFSAIGDRILTVPCSMFHVPCLGIACDGTGYAEDGTIWGGEVFTITKKQKQNTKKFEIRNSKFEINRVAHLGQQTLIGGERAIYEPARLLISILYKIQNTRYKTQKDFIYDHIKKYYTKKEFEVLYNQLEQNFNCIETSSTARILDAVSVLLGFSKNERLSKHGPVKLLEENSTKPYSNINSKIQIANSKQITKSKTANDQTKYILNTTHLFEYLIKNLLKDKNRLAATAQAYIADGLLEIIKLTTKNQKPKTAYFAGGMANNKIISKTLEKQGIYISKKIPSGDAGISVGQIFYYLFSQ